MSHMEKPSSPLSQDSRSEHMMRGQSGDSSRQQGGSGKRLHKDSTHKPRSPSPLFFDSEDGGNAAANHESENIGPDGFPPIREAPGGYYHPRSSPSRNVATGGRDTSGYDEISPPTVQNALDVENTSSTSPPLTRSYYLNDGAEEIFIDEHAQGSQSASGQADYGDSGAHDHYSYRSEAPHSGSIAESQYEYGDERTETGFKDFVANVQPSRVQDVRFPPLSRREIKRRYRSRGYDSNEQDIDIVTGKAGSLQDLMIEIVGRMRGEYTSVVLDEVHNEYVQYANEHRQEFVDKLTKEALPYVEHRVDQHYDQEWKDITAGLDEDIKDCDVRKRAQVDIDVAAYRQAESAQAMIDAKAYRDSCFRNVQTLIDTQSDEAFEELDEAIEATRGRKMARLENKIRRDEQRLRANMTDLVKREVGEEKVQEMTKMRREVGQKKVEEIGKMELDVEQEKVKKLAALDDFIAEEKAKRLAKLDKESGSPVDGTNADIAANGSVIPPAGSVSGKSNVQSNDTKRENSLRNGPDINDGNMEGETLVDTSPNVIAPTANVSASRGKKRSRSSSYVSESNSAGGINKDSGSGNSGEIAETSEEEGEAPPAKRARLDEEEKQEEEQEQEDDNDDDDDNEDDTGDDDDEDDDKDKGEAKEPPRKPTALDSMFTVKVKTATKPLDSVSLSTSATSSAVRAESSTGFAASTHGIIQNESNSSATQTVKNPVMAADTQGTGMVAPKKLKHSFGKPSNLKDVEL